MAFETPVFLFALAAVAAPVIVHLIFRVRKRVVRFGTLRFLRALMKRNRRRLRLRDVLLLIVRAAVVALVALAFARPYFPGGAGESDGGRRDVVFVLDDSFSMSAGRMARTSFDEAKSSVLAELSGMRRGDRAALVLANGGGRTVAPLTDALETVRAGVRAAHVTHERAELAPALRAAAGLLAGSDADIRRIAVASDLQRTAWTEAGLRAVAAGGVVYDSILPPAGQPNLAVVGAEPVTEVWVPGTPVRVRARVANFGDADAGDVAIRLRAGAAGAVRAERSVNVPAGGESAIELAFDAVAPGEVPATVEIDGRDPLAADDMRYLVVSLRGRTHALAVMDEVSAGPSRIGDEDYFLRRALDPRLDDSEAPLTPFETEEIRSRTLDAASLRAADAVCLLGARKLTDDSIRYLADWVRAGGRLLATPRGRGAASFGLSTRTDGGADEEMTFFNERLGEAGLLAARVGKLVADSPRYPDGVPLASWDVSHPVFAAFKAPGATGPDRGGITRFRELRPLEGSRVLAELAGGRAAVVERDLGAGRVVQTAFAVGAADTDLPRHKAFVPFVHGLVAYLARAKDEAGPVAVEVGALLPLAGALAGPHDTGEIVEMISPDGAKVPVAGGAQSGPPHVVAGRPGFYELSFKRRGLAETRRFAVNVPAAESDLRPGEAAAFARALGSEKTPGAGIVAQTRPLGASNHDDREPSSLWAWLLGAAAVMLLAESTMANRLLFRAKGAGTGESEAET